jgi:hypothetical protein
MKAGYTGESMKLDLVIVYGVETNPNKVTVNGGAVSFKYNSQFKVKFLYMQV